MRWKATGIRGGSKSGENKEKKRRRKGNYKLEVEKKDELVREKMESREIKGIYRLEIEKGKSKRELEKRLNWGKLLEHKDEVSEGK